MAGRQTGKSSIAALVFHHYLLSKTNTEEGALILFDREETS